MNLIEILNDLPHHAHKDWDGKTAGLCQLDSNYPLLSDITKKLKSKSILEIGVRYGWSAISFIYGSNQVEHYVGVDCELAGTDYGSNQKSSENIQYFKDKYGLKFDFEILNIDTQKVNNVDFLKGRTFDFIFVDSYHTEDGCYHDMTNLWQVLDIGGTMVVDDSNSFPAVRKGIQRFIEEYKEPNYNIDSFNGDWVITKTKS